MLNVQFQQNTAKKQADTQLKQESQIKLQLC